MIYPQTSPSKPLIVREQDIEDAFIEKLRGLKYTHRPDIRDRAALEQNFRQKFEALNRVRLTDGEFQRLLDELITPTSSLPPASCARRTILPAPMAPRFPTPSSTFATGARTTSRSSTSSVSTPTTATTVTTLSSSSTAFPSSRSNSRPSASARAAPWSRSSNTRTIPATATTASF